MAYENSGESEAQSGSSNTDNSSAAGGPTKQSQVHRCAYCGNSFQRQNSPCMPFCSTRCQQIDLGNWFNEAYSLPADGEEEGQWDGEED